MDPSVERVGTGRTAMLLRKAALLVAAGALLWPASDALAQLSQDAPISTEGTQFVTPPPPPRPTAPVPPAVRPPPPPPPPAPPPPPPQAAPAPAPEGPPPRYPSVVILLDTSDSMLDKSPGKELSHLDEARNAIAEVIRGMSAETRVQVWHFNSRMYPVQVGDARPGTFVPVGETKQRDALIAKLRGIRTAGPTMLYESLVKALDLFSAPADQPLYRSGQRFPVLVVVSDGEDSGTSRVKLEHVQTAKRDHPLVTINAIGFTVAKDNVWFKTLCQIATRPEGCATADDQAQLHSILESFYRPAVAVQ